MLFLGMHGAHLPKMGHIQHIATRSV